MYQLFSKAECPFCWKVRLALTASGIDFTLTEVDTNNKPAELLALSSRGTVPVLCDDDLLLTDSDDILKHIFADSHNVSVDSTDWYFNDYAASRLGAAIKAGIFMRRDQPEATWDIDVLNACQQAWLIELKELESQIDANGPWFRGNQFSLTDCALIPRFGLAEAYSYSGLEDFPKLYRWYRTAKQHPFYTSTRPPICAA